MRDIFLPDLGSRTMTEKMKETVIATLNSLSGDIMKEIVWERNRTMLISESVHAYGVVENRCENKTRVWN
jgi:hypothetical protein